MDVAFDVGQVEKEIGTTLKCGETAVANDGRRLEEKMENSKVYPDGVVGMAVPGDYSGHWICYVKNRVLCDEFLIQAG